MCILIGLFGVTVPNGLVRLYLLFSVRLAVFMGYILAGLNLGSNGYISPICRVPLKIEVGTWPWLIDIFTATSGLSISVSSSFLFSAIDSFSASPTSSRINGNIVPLSLSEDKPVSTECIVEGGVALTTASESIGRACDDIAVPFAVTVLVFSSLAVDGELFSVQAVQLATGASLSPDVVNGGKALSSSWDVGSS